jgi:hypothetical protein
MRGGSFVDGAYSAAFNHLYNAEGGKLALKGAQQALRGLGHIPGIGIAADLASAGISFYTGNYVGGVIDLVSVVPGVGDVAGTALRVAYEGYGAAKWAGKTLGKAQGGAEMLYRGVPGNATEKARLAQQGVAKPRGTAMDPESLRLHVEGGDVNAGVVSFTTDRNVARRFSGESGTIIEVPRSSVEDRIVPRPDITKYDDESEVLIRGTVQGRPTTP